MKKLLTILIISLLLCGCSTPEPTEKGTINATTRIVYNLDNEQIEVSNIIIKCKDAYYGVSVNDSINYNSNNNYFTTGSGLTVMITDKKLKTGSSTKNGVYTAVSKIENGVYLYASGEDETKVKEIFNNVFKTNELSYTFLAHEIDKEWLKEVNITDDVISFSNGTDTIYAYQNDGSLSDGCINGRIEPTVFKKALRGIDIPITYPEETNGEWDYLPYSVKEYEHYTVDGYTPYSAYQMEELITDEYGNTYSTTKQSNMANFIILAKDDQSILSLFNNKNEHTQTLYSLSIPGGSAKQLDLTSDINLSNMKELASSVIDSENRYHFGVLTSTDEDGYYSYVWDCKNNSFDLDQTMYYFDNPLVCGENNTYYEASSGVIPNTMIGKIVVPTIRYSSPEYYGSFLFGGLDGLSQYEKSSLTSITSKATCVNSSNNCQHPADYGAFSSNETWSLHGSENSINEYITGVTSLNVGQSGNFHFINEGDYAYEIDYLGKLIIYKFDATITSYYNDGVEYTMEKGLTTSLGPILFVKGRDTWYKASYEKKIDDNKGLLTCSYVGIDGFEEKVEMIATFSYKW